MKKLFLAYKKGSTALLLTSLTLLMMSCGETFDTLQSVKPVEGAKLKFVHAAPDLVPVDVYYNDVKISGVVVTTNPTGSIAYGTTFPSTGFEYAAVAAGTGKIKLVIPATGAVAYTGDITMESGKNYSFVIAGTAPNYNVLTLKDELPPPSQNQAFYRLVNLVPNSTGASITYNGAVLANDLAYLSATNFLNIDAPTGFRGGVFNTTPFSVQVRGPVNAALTFTGTNITPGFVYTFFVRGLLAPSTTVASRFPAALGVYANR